MCQRDDWPGLLLTNTNNDDVCVDVVDRYGVDYKIRLLCFRRRAGGHFEVDYNASVDVGVDADHNDVDHKI